MIQEAGTIVTSQEILPLADGTVYSRRKNFCPFSTPPLGVYASILGEERIESLHKVARRLKGLKLVELNATAQGGGVAEMLYSSIPLMNALGIEAEWKVIGGNKDYFECTKSLHNQLQGMKGSFTAEMGQVYFPSWKGIGRTIATYRWVRKERRCQLVVAGGLVADDPEGERILASIYDETKDDEDIHVLNLSLANRLENYREVNALQRAASVIMQPSTREGFGLVITEALWKGKPVIASDVGAIPLQIREGATGYFYKTPERTAQKVNYLLENPQAAEIVGKRGRRYVQEHLLLPDRITDYLMAVDITMKATRDKEMPTNSIISFHPWFRLTK